MIHVNSSELTMIYDSQGLYGPYWAGCEGREPRDPTQLRILYAKTYYYSQPVGTTRVEFATYENNLTYYVTEWKKALNAPHR